MLSSEKEKKEQAWRAGELVSWWAGEPVRWREGKKIKRSLAGPKAVEGLRVPLECLHSTLNDIVYYFNDIISGI